MLQGVKRQSSCFHLDHPGSSGKASRKMWYLKWLVQMSRILVVESEKKEEGKDMHGKHRT